MNKFILKVVIFCAFIFTISYLIDFVVTTGLRKNESNVFVDWKNIYDGNIDADVIINGSSIAEVQISPKIIDTVLNIKSYNLGMSGFGFRMQGTRYDIYKQHNKRPKVILHMVGDGTFAKFDELFKTEQFLPYIKDPILNSRIKEYKGLDDLDYIVPFKRYSAKYRTVIKGFSSFLNFEFLKSARYKGYGPNDLGWDNKFNEYIKKYPNGREREIILPIVNSFEKYIETELDNKTQVILVFPPTYYELEKHMLNRSKVVNLYKKISKKYNISFLDYSTSEFSKDKELFYNSTHLNKKGSELFSMQLALDIKKLTKSF